MSGAALLRQMRELVGMYAGSSLWVVRSERVRGLAVPLVLAALVARDDDLTTGGQLGLSFGKAGQAAHSAAARILFSAATAAGPARRCLGF